MGFDYQALNIAQRAAIRDSLARCVPLQTTAGRNDLVSNLHERIRNSIGELSGSGSAANEIFRTCSQYAGGVLQLLQALQAAGDPVAFQNFLKTLQAKAPPGGVASWPQLLELAALLEQNPMEEADLHAALRASSPKQAPVPGLQELRPLVLQAILMVLADIEAPRGSTLPLVVFAESVAKRSGDRGLLDQVRAVTGSTESGLRSIVEALPEMAMEIGERRPVLDPPQPRPAGQKMRWLHLSDWHQRGAEFDRAVVRDALLTDLRERVKIDPTFANLDCVFFTGDLAWSGKPPEYQTAREVLLDPVLEAAGVPKERLYLIPGNHDVDREKFKRLPASLIRPFTDKREVDEWLRDEDLRSDVLKPFVGYQQFVASYGVPGFTAYASHSLIAVGEKTVGIMGCNSALMCGQPRSGTGEPNDYGVLTVGEIQIYEALRAIAKADLRIALIHHPFDWLAQFDRDDVERRLRSEADFVLRGHVHQQQVNVESGPLGSCIIVPGGASYDRRTPERPRYVNAYNFVEVDLETGDGTIFLRKWSDVRNRWMADHDTVDGGKFAFKASGLPRNPAAPVR